MSEELDMTIVEIGLPSAILVLAFLLKLFLDNSPTVTNIIAALFELPVDVAFLATSLIAAYIILSDSSQVEKGLVVFVIYIVGAAIVIILWRRSLGFFIANRHLLSIITASLGYVICVTGIAHAIDLLSGADL